MALIALKIVLGIRLANTVLSPNGHPPLLHVLAASAGDCERFEHVALEGVGTFFALYFIVLFTCLCFIKLGYWYGTVFFFSLSS